MFPCSVCDQHSPFEVVNRSFLIKGFHICKMFYSISKKRNLLLMVKQQRNFECIHLYFSCYFVGSHDLSSDRDLRNPGGALGPVDGLNPDLTNMTCSMTICRQGDLVFLASDGITDNFDPVVDHIAVARSEEANSTAGRGKTFGGKMGGLPKMDAVERHIQSLRAMEGVIRTFEEMREGTCTAQELCADLTQHVLKLTDSRRKVLENPTVYKHEAELSKKEKRRRDKRLRESMLMMPGKLDHASVVAYEVQLRDTGKPKYCSDSNIDMTIKRAESMADGEIRIQKSPSSQATLPWTENPSYQIPSDPQTEKPLALPDELPPTPAEPTSHSDLSVTSPLADSHGRPANLSVDSSLSTDTFSPSSTDTSCKFSPLSNGENVSPLTEQVVKSELSNDMNRPASDKLDERSSAKVQVDKSDQNSNSQVPSGDSENNASLLQSNGNLNDHPVSLPTQEPSSSSSIVSSLGVQSLSSANSSYVSPASESWEFVDDDPPLGEPV